MLIYNLGEPGCLPWHVLNVMRVERCVCRLGHYLCEGQMVEFGGVHAEPGITGATHKRDPQT